MSALKYRPDIDGLRAIAVTTVVAFHAFPQAAPGGFTGVDVFFVISGFLISGLILNGLEDSSFTIRNFYARRIRRILPALTLVLAASLAFGWFALLPDEYQLLGKHAAAAAAFIVNVVFIREAGYFDVAATLKPLLHLWSLSVEEQFYVIWPLLMMTGRRLGIRLAALLGVALLISFQINIDHVHWDPVGTFFGLPTRLWELGLGGVLACIIGHPNLERFDAALDRLLFASRPGVSRILGQADFKAAFGLVLILVMTFTPINQSLFPGWSAVYPTAGAALVIWAGPRAWVNRVILGNPVFVWVGLISYPLYLWHWPLLSFTRIVEGTEPAIGVTLAAIALAVLLAWLTYRLLERPIRRHHRGALAPVALVASLAVVAAAGLGIVSYGGMPSRIANLDNIKQFEWPQLFDLAEGRNDDLNMSVDCRLELFPSTNVNYCRRTWRDRPIDVALLGDSHANMYFDALSPILAQQGKNLLNAGKGGCVPFFGLEGQAYEQREFPLKTVCGGMMTEVLNFVLANPSITTVILTSRDPFYRLPMAQNEKDLARLGDPTSDSFMAKYAQAMRDTLGRLETAGKKVIFAFDVPGLDFDPKGCVNLRPLRLASEDTRATCAIPRSQFEARTAFFRSIVGPILKDFPKVRVFDPSRYLCDKEYCWAMKDGKMLYRDDNHVSLGGARTLAGPFAADALN
jgi:peptidoglycan/LPS O-acetylase OafA/YrhL